MESTVNTDFIIRLIINTLSILILIRCYYGFSRHRENAASFLLFGTGVFVVTAMLHSAEVSMGFAFGLFAVFSMLRYRTEALGTKDMTYLFLVIAMALLGAVGTMSHGYLIAMNIFMILFAAALETRLLLPRLHERSLEYEKIELIKPEKKADLLADLHERTGLDVVSVEVVSLSFLRDTAQLRLHYRPD